jgi:hypothetical protein
VKETKIFMFDDLAYAAGERVEAEDGETVTLRLDGEGVSLDLTAEHAKELRELLAPYFAAGTPAGGGKPPSPAPASHGRQPTDYNQGMREYADARGISYRSASGGVYYSASLRAEYEQYLSAGGR